MTRPDPYRPERPFYYECTGCGSRISADHHPGRCENCGAEMLDVSVPRE